MSVVDKIKDQEVKSKIQNNLDDTDRLISYIRQKGLPKSIEDRKIKEVTLNHYLTLRDYKLSFWVENFKRNMNFLMKHYGYKIVDMPGIISDKTGESTTAYYNLFSTMANKLDVSNLLYFTFQAAFVFNISPEDMLLRDVETLWKKNLRSQF